MFKDYHPTFPSIRKPDEDVARPVPDFLKGAVMYQLFLRPFTPEGTINAARKLIPHIASLGVDIIYLCPVTQADDDLDKAFWSNRQVRSNLDNPCNPYRQRDFFSIDPEYGTEHDLHNLIEDIHACGMKILFDLVYFHCGPTAVFLEDHPDFVVRDENGNIKLGDWKFPELDFSNENLREYLYQNMEYFIQTFKVDGFRCDVADMIPVVFWETAHKRITALNPTAILMCEGLRGDDQHEAFDLTYGFYAQWAIMGILKGKADASEIQTAQQKECIDYPKNFHWMRCFDNHDFAMDTTMSGGRYETIAGQDLCDAMLATIFMLNGVPMLYNGQEIADDAPHSIYANRFHGKYVINWAKALTADGIRRLELTAALTELRHDFPQLFDAPVQWLTTDTPDKSFAFTRPIDDSSSITLAVNISASTVTLPLPISKTAEIHLASEDVRLQEGTLNMPPKSFAIIR